VVASGFEAHSYAGGPRPAVTLSFYRDGFNTALSGSGLVRVIDAAGDAPAVDVGRIPPGATSFVPFDASTVGVTWQQAPGETGFAVPQVPLNPAINAGSQALRFKYSSLSSVDRAFGVVAGAFAPSGDDKALGLVVIKATTAGNWTATLLSPTGK
jgi:hypothetical protein